MQRLIILARFLGFGFVWWGDSYCYFHCYCSFCLLDFSGLEYSRIINIMFWHQRDSQLQQETHSLSDVESFQLFRECKTRGGQQQAWAPKQTALTLGPFNPSKSFGTKGTYTKKWWLQGHHGEEEARL